MGGAASDASEGEALERLAVEAHLAGDEDASMRGFEQAHKAYVRADRHDRAARCAAWVALGAFFRGDTAQAGGWLARAERLLERVPGDCAARGFLLLPTYMATVERGDLTSAHALARDMTDIGQRCGDADLVAFGLLCLGECALARGEPAGMKLLDEVMVSVTTDDLSPLCAGIVYCAVIDKCMNLLDLRRAAEWTQAFERWCATRPDLVPYRGQCLVHRSQVLQAHGSWSDAVAAAEQAQRRLSDPPHPAVGMALYQLGELHRLRGEFADAERAYRAADEHGRPPTPGLALLRLAEGNVAAAAAAVARMLDESAGLPASPVTLAAAVEVFLASGDVERARVRAHELAATATGDAPPLLHAITAYAIGCLALADGDPSAALVSLRRACALCHDLGMPYDVARARVAIALACRAVGDEDAARFELDAARAVFERLAARPDLTRLAVLARTAVPARHDGLTERECDVLRLVAAGKTNREIADALVISQHTVARHLQNTFLKLGVSSRAAATAYAYEHGIV